MTSGRHDFPATLNQSHAVAYQDARGRSFSVEEQEIAWAANLWPAAHDIRWEARLSAAPGPR